MKNYKRRKGKKKGKKRMEEGGREKKKRNAARKVKKILIYLTERPDVDHINPSEIQAVAIWCQAEQMWPRSHWDQSNT